MKGNEGCIETLGKKVIDTEGVIQIGRLITIHLFRGETEVGV